MKKIGTIVIGINVNFYYLYSLNDWTVGLADSSIFVQEAVLQEHLLDICYNAHKNSKYVPILKNEKHLYMSFNE